MWFVNAAPICSFVILEDAAPQFHSTGDVMTLLRQIAKDIDMTLEEFLSHRR
jgi:hypothetical protein